MNWASLKETVDNDEKIKTKFNEFVTNTNRDINYMSDSKPNLSEMEYETLEKLNRESNEVRTQSYNTTVFSLTLHQFFQHWSMNIIQLVQDIMDMIYTKNISVENIYLLINTDNRMFYFGMTMVCLSFLIYLSEIR